LRAWRPITTPPQDRRRQRVDRGSEGARSRQDVGAVDVEDADNPSGFELPGADLSDLELDVVVLPPQEDEFTCIECFLVKHRTQIDHETSVGAVCIECA
jgi:hypothetical protein